MLAVGDGLEHETACGFVAADQLDDDIDIRSTEDRFGIRGQDFGRYGHPPSCRDIQVRNAGQH